MFGDSMAKKSRERRYRLSKCAYCKGTGVDPTSVLNAPCKVCKGTGKIKTLVHSK